MLTASRRDLLFTLLLLLYTRNDAVGVAYSRAAKRLKALKRVISETKRIKDGIAAAEAKRDPATAEALCTEGLDLAPDDVNAKVWYSLKRAKLRQRLAKLAQRETSEEATARAKDLMRGSLRDVGVVTYHDERCVEAFPLKATALQAMGLYAEAVEELEAAAKAIGASGRDPETRPLLEALESAKFELRKSKRLDIYALLNVKPYCTPKQVRVRFVLASANRALRLLLQLHSLTILVVAPCNYRCKPHTKRPR